MKTKILISYDFLTTQPFIGKSGAARFDFLVDILQKLGVNVTLDDASKPRFPIENFFNIHNLEYSDNLVNFIEPDVACLKANDMVKSYLEGFDLLIGYELSIQTRQYLDSIGVSYIDIWFSPIRFCKDAMFSFYSNVESMQTIFKSQQVSNEFLKGQANELAQYCFNFTLNDEELVDNSALVIGQLFVDKACQKENRFLNLLDFEVELKKIATSFHKLYLLKHPLMSEERFAFLVEQLNVPNLEYLQDRNVYELLSSPKIKAVIAVSSSVLVEAEYFGKETAFLYQPVLSKEHINLYKCFYSAKFWIDVLALGVRKDTWIYHNCDNFLRNKFDAFYAYKKFADDLYKPSELNETQLAYNVMIQIGKNVEALSKVDSIIIYGFGTIGQFLFANLKGKLKGIVDKSLSVNDITEIDGIPVLDINELEEGDVILIAAFKYAHKINDDLAFSGKNFRIISLY